MQVHSHCIAGRHIAVHDAVPVQTRQALGSLQAQCQHLPGRQGRLQRCQRTVQKCAEFMFVEKC